MAITAASVKELRERTSAPMMDCKKALVETDGDMEAAVKLMREKGQAKADKKSGRVTAEGLVSIQISEDGHRAAIAEGNCETDFVAKNEHFIGLVDQFASLALANNTDDLEALLAMTIDGNTLDEVRRALIAKIGENLSLRRVALLSSETGTLSSYIHMGRIGVIVSVKNGSDEIARDLAMHIAAVKPLVVRSEEVPAEQVEHEREILTAQAADSGKPPAIIEKMIEGRLKKFLSEVSLLEQPFVKDPDLTVGKWLQQAGAEVEQFFCFTVGEGIERETTDFAAEVMAQVQGN